MQLFQKFLTLLYHMAEMSFYLTIPTHLTGTSTYINRKTRSVDTPSAPDRLLQAQPKGLIIPESHRG